MRRTALSLTLNVACTPHMVPMTAPRHRLMLTLLLLMIVIWLFAVWTATLANAYSEKDLFSNNVCSSLGRCWISIVDSISSGALPVAPADTEVGDSVDLFTNLYALHLIFFIVVQTVLMNIVFGIIIDTFAELREEKAAKQAHMQNVCFICGIDRFTFDTKGDGFEEHIRRDHYMWSYLGLLVHVFEKPASTHNGWESYVAAKVEEQDTSFLPRNTAFVLQQAKKAEDKAMRAEGEALVERLDDVDTKLDHLRRMMEAVSKHQGLKIEPESVDLHAHAGFDREGRARNRGWTRLRQAVHMGIGK